jgi:hypothetical protein
MIFGAVYQPGEPALAVSAQFTLEGFKTCVRR